MLGFLFRGLTAEPNPGAGLFAAINGRMRRPHWYVEGQVPDTIDGRFAVLATLTAMVLVRLEHGGDEGNRASVALTEQFIEVMESEHRELGLGDPTLGKTVRKLVGSLARRVDIWRDVAGGADLTEAARQSLYKAGSAPADVDHVARALLDFQQALESTSIAALMEGKFE